MKIKSESIYRKNSSFCSEDEFEKILEGVKLRMLGVIIDSKLRYIADSKLHTLRICDWKVESIEKDCYKLSIEVEIDE